MGAMEKHINTLTQLQLMEEYWENRLNEALDKQCTESVCYAEGALKVLKDIKRVTGLGG